MKNYSGNTINQYYLSKDLGQGGMVVVYKAFDNALNRDVVVKMIRTEGLDGTKRTDIVQRFTPLANSLLRLNHPNIAPLLDHGFFEDVPYFVAQFLPGGTLKQRMRKQLSLKAATQVLSPIADALIYAHHNGVLHQDFKPSNVLFHNQDKRPMLKDLGIASLFTDSVFDQELFELGFGTPAYMAPEQWRGLATEQSDVYSVGIVFYEMLTGKIANKVETPLAAAFKQNEGLIPDPTEMVGGLSPEVQHFFFKCLALEPYNRFQSMEEMKLAMERLTLPSGPQKGKGIESGNPQSTKPDVDQGGSVSKMSNEAAQIKPIRKEPIHQPQQSVAPPFPIQADFHPSLKPDYIKSRIAPQPSATPLPPTQLRQKPAKAKLLTEKTVQAKPNDAPRVFKTNPWVTAIILGLVFGLAHVIKVSLIEGTDFLQSKWIPSLIGRTFAWLLAGFSIFFYYHRITRLKLSPAGLAGFVLAGIIPSLVEEIVSFPFGSWLSEIAMWLFLAIGVGLMFLSSEKHRRSQELALIGGWTTAGVLSVLPLLVSWLFDTTKTEAPLYVHFIQGLILGALLAVAVHKSFLEHFKHDQNGLVKLVAIFSVAGAISCLIYFGVQNIFLASGISWFAMISIVLMGVGWATVPFSAPKASSSQSVTIKPENWKHK